MDFFKANMQLKSLKPPIVKMIIAIAVMILCFFRACFIPTNLVFLQHVGSIIALILTAGCIYRILISGIEISQFLMSRPKLIKQTDHPIKIWSFDEMLSFLEKENIIDLTVEGDFGIVKLGTRSDFGSPTYLAPKQWFNKCYYIEDCEYNNILEFQEAFKQLVSSEKIKVLSAYLDDMELNI